MLALEVAAETAEELGGVISIGGPVSSAVAAEVGKKSKSPVLVCKGRVNSAVGEREVKRIKDVFEFVSVREWKRDEDGMPGNREEVSFWWLSMNLGYADLFEMLPIMQFFGRRLLSAKGVPEGSIQLA
jgi:hypothetical protein